MTHLLIVSCIVVCNTVWHRSLTCKLLRHLPDKHMIRMIMELVQNRRFTLTTCDSKRNRLCRLKNYVPQGSVLALLLFNIYTYDLPSTIFRKFAYADDLALLHSSGNWKDSEGALSQDTTTLSTYYRRQSCLCLAWSGCFPKRRRRRRRRRRDTEETKLLILSYLYSV